MATKNPKGKAIGGKARAASLTPEKRKEISARAIAAKKEKAKLPRATHGKDDHPLRIGDIEIPCYVLEDGRRVLAQRGMVSALGMSRGGSSKGGGDRLAHFIGGKALEPFIGAGLREVISSPIQFVTQAGNVANAYDAQMLADICEAVLQARAEDKLQKQQMHIAQQCEVLMRGFARVGIIALVDEATGYQKDRAKDALAKILETFVAKELQPYVQTFPSDFYEEMFRLRGLKYPPENPNFRPQYFGLLTNDIVYERIAPGLLEELKKQARKDEKKAHLHRRLTQEIGHPKLREHLASVVTAMKLSNNYPDFICKLNRVHPRFGKSFSLDLDDEDRG